jgi:hypothetical protein
MHEAQVGVGHRQRLEPARRFEQVGCDRHRLCALS